MGHEDDETSPWISTTRPTNTRIMIAAIVVLFIVVLFILVLHIYARWFWRTARLRSGPGLWSRRRRRFSFAGATQVQAAANVVSKGLEKSVLNSLPVFSYTRKVKAGQPRADGGKAVQDEEEVLDCAVCLSEFEENETGRRLPKCNHVFHTDCIDMWFGSHTTCPLCRASVVDEDVSCQGEEILREAVMVNLQGRPAAADDARNALAIQILQEEGAVLLSHDPTGRQQEQFHVITIDPVNGGSQSTAGSAQHQNQFPASVLFWGNQTYVNSVVNSPTNVQVVQEEQVSESVGSSSSKQQQQKQLVIEVPRRSANFSACSSQLPSPTISDGGQRSPLGNHLRNIKRLLSRDSRRCSMDGDCSGDPVPFHSTPTSGCQTPC